MKTYNEFKPTLVESNNVGTIPKFRKNILAFSLVGIIAIGTIAGSLFYTSYKTTKLENEYQAITEITQSNNDLISKNLAEIKSLMQVYPEDDRNTFLTSLTLQGVKPIEIVSAENAYNMNDEARKKYEEAIEIIENSPFRHINITSQDKTDILLNGSHFESKELQKFQEAQKVVAPKRFDSDVLAHYKRFADESLSNSFMSAEYSRIALDEVRKASDYLTKYNNFISNIEKTMKLDGVQDDLTERTVNNFKSSVTAREFIPQFTIGKNNRPISSGTNNDDLMDINFKKAEEHHDSIIAILDEQRPALEPKKAEVNEAVIPKAEDFKPKEVEAIKEAEKPKQQVTPKPKQQAPRRQQNNVPSW